MRLSGLLPTLLLLAAGLAGCNGDGDDVTVENACTAHANYGTGNPHVTLRTNLGNITAEIFVDKAPNTGMNFVKLAENGTYDGVPFHRIITDFMMQGGDHTNKNGSGGQANPDCDTGDGDIVDEYDPALRHDSKGTLSMANAGPDSASSQFFITFVETRYLDGYDAAGNKKACGQIDPTTGRPYSCHAVFGKVREGMDVLDKVEQQAASSSGAPRTPVTLLSTDVEWPGA